MDSYPRGRFLRVAASSNSFDYLTGNTTYYSFRYGIDVFAIDARPAVPEPDGYVIVVAGLVGAATIYRRRIRSRLSQISLRE